MRTLAMYLGSGVYSRTDGPPEPTLTLKNQNIIATYAQNVLSRTREGASVDPRITYNKEVKAVVMKIETKIFIVSSEFGVRVMDALPTPAEDQQWQLDKDTPLINNSEMEELVSQDRFRIAGYDLRVSNSRELTLVIMFNGQPQTATKLFYIGLSEDRNLVIGHLLSSQGNRPIFTKIDRDGYGDDKEFNQLDPIVKVDVNQQLETRKARLAAKGKPSEAQQRKSDEILSAFLILNQAMTDRRISRFFSGVKFQWGSNNGGVDSIGVEIRQDYPTWIINYDSQGFYSTIDPKYVTIEGPDAVVVKLKEGSFRFIRTTAGDVIYEEIVDAAMIGNQGPIIEPARFTKGGIDFAEKYLEMNIEGELGRLTIPPQYAWINSDSILGFKPNIRSITQGVGKDLFFFKGIFNQTIK